jgi:hypothetical protein
MSLFDSGIWRRGGRVAGRNQEPEQERRNHLFSLTIHLIRCEYYKQKEEEIDKMEKNIQTGNKLSVIKEKILIDKYLSLTPTL